MYFFDSQDFAFPRGSATGSMQIFWRDTWFSHYYMRDFVFVNNPDGTLGIYYDANEFTGSTKNIQNFTSQITEEYCNVLSAKFDEVRIDLKDAFYNGLYLLPDCYRYNSPYTCASETFATFFQSYGLYKNVPNCYWDTTRNVCATKNYPVLNEGESQTYAEKCCGDDFKVDFDKLTTEPLSAAKTNEQFDLMMNTELIDAKSRKTISTYPTLRALYDRYINSSFYTGVQSSAYNYEKMELITKKVGNDWIDIVEQVIPSTTIWGVVKIYGNTVFDQEKYQYKNGNLMTCINGFEDPSNTSWDFLNECVYSQIEKFYSTCGSVCETGNCDGETSTISSVDFMDDPRNMPTPAEIDSWSSANCADCDYTSLESVANSYEIPFLTQYDDIASDIRAQRDKYVKDMGNYQTAFNLGFCADEMASVNYVPNIDLLKKITAPTDPTSPYYNQPFAWPFNFYFKGVPKKMKTYLPYKASLDMYWYYDPSYAVPLGAILSAYTDDVRFVKSVSVVSELPTIGNAGDLIVVGDPTSNVGYAWDPRTSSWSTTLYTQIASGVLDTRRARRDASRKALNQLLLAQKPFLWGGNYLLLHPFKKWPLQNAAPVTGKQIIETNGGCLPCIYTNTIDCEVTTTLCLGERTNWTNYTCDTQQQLFTYSDMRTLDFLDDLTVMPSFENLVTLPYTSGTVVYNSDYTILNKSYEYETLGYFDDYRAESEAIQDLEEEVMSGLHLGFDRSQLPTINYNNVLDHNFDSNKLASQRKGKIKKIKYRWWRIASTYEGWTGATFVYSTHNKTLKEIFPNVIDVKYLSAVANSSLLPTTATAGDLICVGTPSSYVGYAWDPILNSWSSSLYTFMDDEVLSVRVGARDAHIKAKREIMLAIKPFLFANEYLPAHGVKQWMYGDAKNFDPSNIQGSDVTFDYTYNNGSLSLLPPAYTMTATTHIIPAYTADTKLITY